MTYNQDMILYLQHRIVAMDKELKEKDNRLVALQERCDYLESEREHLLNQLLDKPYTRLLSELPTRL
jgi:hypothetical protein